MKKVNKTKLMVWKISLRILKIENMMTSEIASTCPTCKVAKDIGVFFLAISKLAGVYQQTNELLLDMLRNLWSVGRSSSFNYILCSIHKNIKIMKKDPCYQLNFVLYLNAQCSPLFWFVPWTNLANKHNTQPIQTPFTQTEVLNY